MMNNTGLNVDLAKDFKTIHNGEISGKTTGQNVSRRITIMDLKKNQLSSEDNGGETNFEGMQQQQQ